MNWEWLPAVKKLRAELAERQAELDYNISECALAKDEQERLCERLEESRTIQAAQQAQLLAQNEKFTDWMAVSMGRPSVFGNNYEIKREPVELQPKDRRQARDLQAEAIIKEQQHLRDLVNAAEKDLGLTQ